MTYILGLCTMGNSAASLFKDGNLIAAVEEERLSRIKNDNRFPHNAINEVLSISKINLSDVSLVSVYWKPWEILTRAKYTSLQLLTSAKSRKTLMRKIFELSNPSEKTGSSSWIDLFTIRKKLVKNHGNFLGRIEYHNHHFTHQIYAEGMRDWDKYFSLSYDGGGEKNSTELWVIKNNHRKKISTHCWPNSLGHFYSTFTGFLGFKMLEGEYKMMGLAPYGEPIWKKKILEKILILKPNGRYQVNTKLCNYHLALDNIFDKELEALFCKKRIAGSKPDKNHINLAASVQASFEEALTHILKPALNKYADIKKLVISGGCALNVTANGKLISNNLFNEIIIPPAPHDAGCAIGAALCSLKKRNIKFNSNKLRSPYLGRNYSSSDIKQIVYRRLKNPPDIETEENLILKTAKFLSEGKLIAWFQGRSEFGPRALGARSFLADPREDKIREVINQKIKKRELFRPFAPSTIKEFSNSLFSLDQVSPYMNIVASVISRNIPAITHIDNTARVHTVDKQSHFRYYSLIKKFGELTGTYCLLNTSFNIQEPIVYTPEDALDTFIDSGVDLLVIGDYIIERKHI